ncbi:MAG TPA: glycosyltransferase [Usitatibacter sp.]|nr:glycosyltransferase [Usitatibacter sp.]
MTRAAPFVSCLCVTRARVPLLRRAVACFQRQGHAQRELVVVYDADDVPTRRYLEELGDDRVRAVEAPASPRMKLGSLRNLAVESARGAFIAQWDDDDWHAPDRLSRQLDALGEGGKPACVLWQWTLFDSSSGQAYLSTGRPWEGSLVAERAGMPAYPDFARFEDTPLVASLAQAGNLVALQHRPDLYIYVHHGANTWGRVHWKREVLRGATPLPADESRRVAAVLAAIPETRPA